MTTLSKLQASMASLTCGAALLVAPVRLVRGQEGEQHVVLVNVLDRDGNQVPGLSTANFRGEYRGKPLTVVSVTPDKNPRRIAMLVDPSSSQPGSPEWSAAEELVKCVTPQHSAIVLTAAGANLRLSERTTDEETLIQALRGASAMKKPFGLKTPMEGVMQASGAFRDKGLDNVVCLFSNGLEPFLTDPTVIVRAVAQTGVRVIVVLTPGFDQRVTGWTASVAEATGGVVCRLPALQKKLHTINSMITDAYRLEIALPLVVDQQRKWKLEVVGPDGKKLPNVELVYPHMVSPVVPPK